MTRERDIEFINALKKNVKSFANSVIRGLESDDDFKLEMAVNMMLSLDKWLELSHFNRSLYCMTTINHQEKALSEEGKPRTHPAYIYPKEKTANEKLVEEILKKMEGGLND